MTNLADIIKGTRSELGFTPLASGEQKRQKRVTSEVHSSFTRSMDQYDKDMEEKKARLAAITSSMKKIVKIHE
jgi:hypothetical protein